MQMGASRVGSVVHGFNCRHFQNVRVPVCVFVTCAIGSARARELETTKTAAQCSSLLSGVCVRALRHARMAAASVTCASAVFAIGTSVLRPLVLQPSFSDHQEALGT